MPKASKTAFIDHYLEPNYGSGRRYTKSTTKRKLKLWRGRIAQDIKGTTAKKWNARNAKAHESIAASVDRGNKAHASAARKGLGPSSKAAAKAADRQTGQQIVAAHRIGARATRETVRQGNVKKAVIRARNAVIMSGYRGAKSILRQAAIRGAAAGAGTVVAVEAATRPREKKELESNMQLRRKKENQLSAVDVRTRNMSDIDMIQRLEQRLDAVLFEEDDRRPGMGRRVAVGAGVGAAAAGGLAMLHPGLRGAAMMRGRQALGAARQGLGKARDWAAPHLQRGGEMAKSGYGKARAWAAPHLERGAKTATGMLGVVRHSARQGYDKARAGATGLYNEGRRRMGYHGPGFDFGPGVNLTYLDAKLDDALTQFEGGFAGKAREGFNKARQQANVFVSE